MKWKLLCGRISLFLILAGWACGAAAAPKYTDKENALNLAEALDKGIFRNNLITSTFIQSVGKGRYFLKVILDNGAERNWDINQLRAHTKRESIVLKNNRALLFPSEESNKFVTLDKGAFARQALAARVYVKRYESSDVLAGQEIKFGIHRFNLVHLLGMKPGNDEHGYRHHYVLDLENGQRDLLSYLDAYNTFSADGLVVDAASVSPIIRAPYRIQEIKPMRLKPLGPSGTGKFGVELTFDRPLDLQPGHFPFRFFENGNGRKSRAGARPKFMVEVTAPNAVMGREVAPIETLEFLRQVHVVPDRHNPVRVLMRATVSPEVMNFPPEVEVVGSTVRISFIKVIDQSVFDRQALAQKELRIRQDRLLHRTLSPEEIEMRKSYNERMESGNNQLHTARRAKAFQDRYAAFQQAMEHFQVAASHATNDLALDDALRARNSVMVKLPVLVVDHVRKLLKSGARVNKGPVREMLENASLLTRDRRLLDAIGDLLNDPNL